MGNCLRCFTSGSNADFEKNLKIQQEIDQTAKDDSQRIKLLLLGSGESGKSTLFKQMVTLYGKGYSEEERRGFKSIIEQNALSAIQALIDATSEILDQVEGNTTMLPEARKAADIVEPIPANLGTQISEEAARNIKIVWEDPGIQVCYENRRLLQFPDSGKYFLDKVLKICTPDYIPTQEDLLRSRVKTTGIIETEFEIEKTRFNMFDVGGQRTERKKWIHCFENVTCVIFVAAISEYDQVLCEDEETPRMQETLQLFDEIVNSAWFAETSFILFLNKRDLFEEKIKHSPITDYVEGFEGDPTSYEDCCNFIERTFHDLNRHPDKEIYSHITCATDTDNVQHVFDSVRRALIKGSLREGGFI